MSRRKGWKDCYEYKRILEILSDYWGTEPDEEYARVDMYFRHKNGEEQAKTVAWRNGSSYGPGCETTYKPPRLLLDLWCSGFIPVETKMPEGLNFVAIDAHGNFAIPHGIDIIRDEEHGQWCIDASRYGSVVVDGEVGTLYCWENRIVAWMSLPDPRRLLEALPKLHKKEKRNDRKNKY